MGRQRGYGIAVAAMASMGVTVIAFGEALQVGGRAWLSVAVGVVLFGVCLIVLGRRARRR